MKTALIIGGTGLIGKQLTHLLIGDKRYKKIILLVREPMNLIHHKMEQVKFDFENPDATSIKADDIFCCIGTTIKIAGSKTAFRKVDFEYVLNIARVGFRNGARQFALVSSMGANKNSFFFYNKIKGEIEEAVKLIGYKKFLIFRPSVLIGHRNVHRFSELVSIFFLRIFSFVIPTKYKPIESDKVAKAMLVMMNNPVEGIHIYESDAIAMMNFIT